MARAVICKGDPTSHGGQVLEGSAEATIDGRDKSRNTVRQFDGVMAVSTAHGYGQFTDAGWTDALNRYGEKYGVHGAGTLSPRNAAAHRTDEELQAAMLAELTKTNIAKGRLLGGNDDDANVYALHNLGPGDGQRFLRALAKDRSTPVQDVLSREVIKGNSSLYGNGSIALQEAYGRMSAAMAGGNQYADEARSLSQAKNNR